MQDIWHRIETWLAANAPNLLETLQPTHDGAGNHDCLDLSPAAGGNVGQIISMWHDGDARELLAPSFQTWLQTYVEGLESGRLVYAEVYGCIADVEYL